MTVENDLFRAFFRMALQKLAICGKRGRFRATETIVLSDILHKVLPVYEGYKNDNEFDFKQKLYLKSFSAQ